MYQILLTLHSQFRWLVLASLLLSVYKAWMGYRKKKTFSKADNTLRHLTATIAHIQLVAGVTIYIKSPHAQHLLSSLNEGYRYDDSVFFGFVHILLMVLSIVLVTIGSAVAKRKITDKEKFRTMLVWFGPALYLIFIAIPWPFSPLAQRPYFRTF